MNDHEPHNIVEPTEPSTDHEFERLTDPKSGEMTKWHLAVDAKHARKLKECTSETTRERSELREESMLFPPFAEIEGNLNKDLSPEISWDIDGTLMESPDPEKMVLTFDICYPYNRNANYKKLGAKALQTLKLIKEKTEYPVILFVTGIALENKELRTALADLATCPHVSIQPHGMNHLPVTSEHSKKIYGKQPTGSLEGAYVEITEGAKKIQELTGKRPKYFRAPTLFTDARVVDLTGKLGMRMVSATEGDNGGKFKKGGVIAKGIIYIGHAINFQGARSVYERLESEKIATTHLE